MRLVLGIEYDGSPFCGWQRQIEGISVQQELESAISKIADSPVRVFCSGRTDKGVHGLEQVIHFDTSIERPHRAWILGTNTHLPSSIRVKWVKEVPESFHARFSALNRRYIYLINNDGISPGLYHQFVAWFRKPLSVELMNTAAQHLVGEHDFSAFRAAECQAHHPVRMIHHLKLHRQGNTIIADVKANGFLYHMVRNIMGVLFAIGCEEYPVDWVKTVLASCDRCQGGITAPAGGLYFVQAEYPREFELPQASTVSLMDKLRIQN